MRTAGSHAVGDRIEATLKSQMEHIKITVDVEPEAKAEQHGILVL
jgi:divalent metal cation (Fe/Co/Zn/Cd) transporter